MESYLTIPPGFEVWKDLDLPELDGRYQINNFGEVRAKETGQVYTYSLGAKGYYITKLRLSDGRTRSYSTHRLKAIAFIPNPDNLPEINHKNGIKKDIRLLNLEWSTSSDNQKHAYRLGLRKKLIGDKNAATKLTVEQVKKIKSELLIGLRSCYAISKEFDIDSSVIYKIRDGINWKHVNL